MVIQFQTQCPVTLSIKTFPRNCDVEKSLIQGKVSGQISSFPNLGSANRSLLLPETGNISIVIYILILNLDLICQLFLK